MFRLCGILAIAVLACCALAVAGHASIVVNGGFESGAYSPGWDPVGDQNYGFTGVYTDGEPFANAQGYPIVYPVHSGTYGLLLGAPYGESLGGAQQTLATVPGQEYVLSFWVRNPANTQDPLPNEFQVQWDGVSLYDNEWHSPSLDPDSHGVWVNWTFDVVASSSATLLSFEGKANDAFAVDDVSVDPVPEPATILVWSLLGAASWLGMRVWRGGQRLGRRAWAPENRQAILEIINR